MGRVNPQSKGTADILPGSGGVLRFVGESSSFHTSSDPRALRVKGENFMSI